VYFGKDGAAIVILLGGGTKKRQGRDIADAQACWQDYKQRKRARTMPLTKDFKETVRARLIRSPGFRRAVLQEAVDGLLAGDVDTGKALLRDYVNGTMGFERLAKLTHIPAKSLMRMLGPKGNPQARNLFDVIGHLQRAEGVRFQVSLKNTTKGRAA
jgi:DNA-binding phage protein